MRPEDITVTYDFAIVARRWGATWLDFLLFGGTLVGMMLLAGEKSYGPAMGCWLALVLLYYPLLEGLTGRTFGKLICGLKVVDERGEVPGIPRALLRTLVRLVEVNPFLMGGLPAGIAVMCSKTRQRLGDMAARTFVLKNEDLVLLANAAGSVANYYGSASAIPASKPNNWAVPAASVVTLAAIALIWGGNHAIQRAEAVRKPITMTCKEFLRSPHTEGWYHLTGCSMNMAGAAYEYYHIKSSTYDSTESIKGSRDSLSHSVSGVLIPLYANDDEDQKTTPLVVQSNREEDKSLMEEIRSKDDEDEKAVQKWVLANQNRIFVERDITGTVESGDSILESTRDEIKQLNDKHIAPSYVLLQEGEKPWDSGGIAAIVIGVLFCGLAFILWGAALFMAVQRPGPPRLSGPPPLR